MNAGATTTGVSNARGGKVKGDIAVGTGNSIYRDIWRLQNSLLSVITGCIKQTLARVIRVGGVTGDSELTAHLTRGSRGEGDDTVE